jgi:hypothetical protein
MSENVHWAGEPDRCAYCNEPPKRRFADMRLPFETSWGIVCETCLGLVSPNDPRFGTGFGQLYDLQPDGKWLKVRP